MPRRRKSSLYEDLFDIAAMLPWWAGLLLALISFISFHSAAQMEVVPPTEFGQHFSRQLFKTLSSILQYLIPAIFCLGAATSFFNQLKRRMLFNQVHGEQITVAQLSWKEFGLLVGEAFRQRGYSVVETGDGADGGVDLILTKNGDRFLVQCKHWKSGARVSVMVVRELLGVMTSQKAKGGFVVASGGFTKDAEEFARQNGIKLIGRDELSRMIQAAQTSIKNHRNLETPQNSPAELKIPQSKPSLSPTCPICHADMVKRTATRGSNRGSEFWGCSRFPKCRGTISIP
jgi:restriction system protein